MGRQDKRKEKPVAAKFMIRENRIRLKSVSKEASASQNVTKS